MLKNEEIVAMAIAAIADDLNLEIKKIRVKSFNEAQQSSLEKYIQENHIEYSKYKLVGLR